MEKDQHSSPDVSEQLIQNFLANKMSSVKKTLQQFEQPTQMDFGRRLFEESKSASVSGASKLVTELPLFAQVGFWMSALSSDDRDWNSESSLIAPCLFSLLQEGAKDGSVTDLWWQQWKTVVLLVVQSGHSQKLPWARDMREFLNQTPPPSIEMTEVIVALDKTLALDKKVSKANRSKPSTEKKKKNSVKGVSEPFQGQWDSLISEAEQLIRQFVHFQTKWNDERQALKRRIVDLEQEQTALVKTKEEHEQRITELKEERDEDRLKRNQLLDEVSTEVRKNRALQDELQEVTVQRDQLKSDVNQWKRAAEMHEHRATQIRDGLILEFRHRARKKVVPLAGYVKNRIEEMLRTEPPNDTMQLLALEFDELHREILREADVSQDDRIDPALLSQLRGESDE